MYLQQLRKIAYSVRLVHTKSESQELHAQCTGSDLVPLPPHCVQGGNAQRAAPTAAARNAAESAGDSEHLHAMLRLMGQVHGWVDAVVELLFPGGGSGSPLEATASDALQASANEAEDGGDADAVQPAAAGAEVGPGSSSLHPQSGAAGDDGQNTEGEQEGATDEEEQGGDPEDDPREEAARLCDSREGIFRRAVAVLYKISHPNAGRRLQPIVEEPQRPLPPLPLPVMPAHGQAAIPPPWHHSPLPPPQPYPHRPAPVQPYPVMTFSPPPPFYAGSFPPQQAAAAPAAAAAAAAAQRPKKGFFASCFGM